MYLFIILCSGNKILNLTCPVNYECIIGTTIYAIGYSWCP